MLFQMLPNQLRKDILKVIKCHPKATNPLKTS